MYDTYYGQGGNEVLKNMQKTSSQNSIPKIKTQTTNFLISCFFFKFFFSFSPPPPFRKSIKKCYIEKNDGVNSFFLSQYDPYHKTCYFIFCFSKKNEKNEKEQKGTKKNVY